MDLSSIKESLIEQWQKPQTRKAVVITVVLVFISFIAFSTDDIDTGGAIEGQVGEVKKVRKVEANFFTQSGADNIDQGRMDEVYTLMEEQLAEREKDIDEKEQEMRMMENRVMKELETLRFSQNDLKRELDVQKLAKQDTRTQSKRKTNTFTPNALTVPTEQSVPANNNQPLPMAQALQTVAPRKVVDHKRVGLRTIETNSDRFVDSQGVVTELKVDPEANAKDVAEASPVIEKEEEEDTQIFLPAGSLISGVLITGMDIPTGNSVKRDPFPAILRIKQEALLPNNFTVDLRECVIVASAVGDLASRRAYLRAEAISCVTDEGKAVEANLNAFAVGQDGRNGVAGRLVSRNGEAVMKSAWAGFLSGIANLSSTSAFSISDQETGFFTAAGRSEVLASMASTAALQGAGNAMDRLADYYVEIADQMKPYIEINPGIEIDFIIQRGTSIKIK